MNVDWNVVIAGFLGMLTGFVAGVRYTKWCIIEAIERVKVEAERVQKAEYERTNKMKVAMRDIQCKACGCNGDRLKITEVSTEKYAFSAECIICGEVTQWKE